MLTKFLNLLTLSWLILDAGSGMVYSIDGNKPSEEVFTFLVELESLSEEGWYFYVDDYNEWRRQNSD